MQTHQPLLLLQPADQNAAPGANSTAAPSEPVAPTAEQMTAIKAAIANAQTLAEVQQLEAALKAGRVPEGIIDSGDGSAAMDQD